MPTAQAIFIVLGLVFLALGGWRCLSVRRWVPQGRAWLIVGAIFVAVAAWLELVAPVP